MTRFAKLIRRWTEIVNLDETNAVRAVRAADDRGVAAGIERHLQSGFGGLCWREAFRLDLRGLGVRSPVIIEIHQIAGRIPQLHGWIRECAGHAESAQ